MNWDQALVLVQAMNTIDALRSDPQGYLTIGQYAAVGSLRKVLEAEGFQVTYRVDSQATRGWSYKIASQLTYA